MGIDGDAKTDQRFRKAREKTARKLNSRKSCIRFKRLEEVPLKVVGQLIARTPVADYIARIGLVFQSTVAKRTKSRPYKTKR